jgi:hypothetical protein
MFFGERGFNVFPKQVAVNPTCEVVITDFRVIDSGDSTIPIHRGCRGRWPFRLSHRTG